MMPILAPAGVQEILDYGALGWALSRYAGVWVGLKCVKDTVESTAVVDASLDRVAPVARHFPLPPGGLDIRRVDGVLAQEERLHKRSCPPSSRGSPRTGRTARSRPAAHGEARRRHRREAHLDVRQALDALGLDEARCESLGLRLYKIRLRLAGRAGGSEDVRRRPRRDRRRRISRGRPLERRSERH